MYGTSPLDEGHIPEGDLVRYLDDEMTKAERGVVARHLIACTACVASLDALRADRARLASLLGELVPPAVDLARRAASLEAIERAAKETAAVRPAHRRSALRAAAVASVLLASAAVASAPVRGALTDLWFAVTGQADRSIVEETREVERLPLSGATIAFIPSGESFLLEIASRQADGDLILGVSPGASVTATAIDGQRAVDLVILPDGMRIENEPDATGDYAVSLPSSLRELRIRIAGRPDQILQIDQLSGSWISVIELSDGAEPAF